MTPQQLKAMKMALEALELLTGAWQTFDALDYGDNAITAIKEALAEHAMQEVQRLGQEIEPKIGCVNHDCDQCKAQPEQEPVAWMDKYGEIYKDVPEVLSTDKPLYTSPPQRQPLTGAQISAIGSKIFPSTWNIRHLEFARAIEAAHGIKENT